MVKSLTHKEEIMKNNKYVNGDVYRNYKPIATIGICNMLSLDIIDINDEKITTIFSDGTSRTTAKIHYDEDGNSYFKKYGVRYNLDEFIRL